MTRNFTCKALCLRVRPSGVSNREAWFLCSEKGILKATVFGGAKSKLRSLVSPFHQGTLWLYIDPVRDSIKVTDFDAEVWRPGLRELYERCISADMIAETVLATHGGGGGWNEALGIASSALDCLETADRKSCERIILHFLWKWTDFLGIKPDLERCGSCARELSVDKIVWYDQKDGSLYCCGHEHDQCYSLPPSCRRWLLTAGQLEPREALRYTMDDKSFQKAKNYVLGLLADVLDKSISRY